MCLHAFITSMLTSSQTDISIFHFSPSPPSSTTSCPHCVHTRTHCTHAAFGIWFWFFVLAHHSGLLSTVPSPPSHSHFSSLSHRFFSFLHTDWGLGHHAYGLHFGFWFGFAFLPPCTWFPSPSLVLIFIFLFGLLVFAFGWTGTLHFSLLLPTPGFSSLSLSHPPACTMHWTSYSPVPGRQAAGRQVEAVRLALAGNKKSRAGQTHSLTPPACLPTLSHLLHATPCPHCICMPVKLPHLPLASPLPLFFFPTYFPWRRRRREEQFSLRRQPPPKSNNRHQEVGTGTYFPSENMACACVGVCMGKLPTCVLPACLYA